jgi:SagB-type dehydrogenase family enzyme
MTSPYQLSPYCVLHPSTDGSKMVLTHALYGSRFVLEPELVRAVARLLDGSSRDALVAEGPPELLGALDALIEEKVLVGREEIERLGGAELFRNRLDPLELAVQRGFNEGGSLVGMSTDAAPPLRKKMRGEEEIPLASHEDFGEGQDLVECLGKRRSRRFFADAPIPLQRFEQLLQLCVRMRSTVATPDAGEIGFRSFPSGGARQPLEVYTLVQRVESIPAGLHHYDAHGHALSFLGDPGAARQALVEDAMQKLGAPFLSRSEPAVLLVITAVFARTCWKYQRIPYQLILQEVGALEQALYLAATRLGLAACAIGAFPELAMSEILGVDSRDEAQVGLLALGVPSDEPEHGDATASPSF